MSNLQINQFLDQIEDLKTWKAGGEVRPHKFIFLLSVCQLINENPKRENKFPFNSRLRNKFSELMAKYFGDTNSFPEYPYYHLASSPLWNHKIRKGKEEEYKKRRRFTPKKIEEIIEYAFLDQKFFEILKYESLRNIIIFALEDKISKIKNKNPKPDRASTIPTKKSPVYFPKPSESREHGMVSEKRHPQIKSNFPHEQKALEKIFSALEKHVELIPNYDLYDPSTNQYLECDLLVLCTDGVAVVELKHWAGQIEIRPQHWLRGPEETPWRDPHLTNSYKCKVLKSFCNKHFPFIRYDFWFQSVVLLTNPDATVYNASPPDTELDNPTFQGIDVRTYAVAPMELMGTKFRLALVKHQYAENVWHSFGLDAFLFEGPDTPKETGKHESAQMPRLGLH